MILVIKVHDNVDDWIKKYYKKFHEKLYKEGIYLGRIVNIDRLKNEISFELVNVDVNRLKNVLQTLSDVEAVPVGSVILILGGLITTYLIAKGLTKEFKILSVEVRETLKPLLNPITLLLLGGIIFILAGGLKLFKEK